MLDYLTEHGSYMSLYLAGCSNPCTRCRSRCYWRCGVWDHHHLCSRLHGLCYSCRPQEGFTGNHSAHSNRLHCWCQHSRRWPIQWGLNEPGPIFRPSRGQRQLFRYLDLLGRATYWWWACRASLWWHFHCVLCPGPTIWGLCVIH